MKGIVFHRLAGGISSSWSQPKSAVTEFRVLMSRLGSPRGSTPFLLLSLSRASYATALCFALVAVTVPPPPHRPQRDMFLTKSLCSWSPNFFIRLCPVTHLNDNTGREIYGPLLSSPMYFSRSVHLQGHLQ